MAKYRARYIMSLQNWKVINKGTHFQEQYGKNLPNIFTGIGVNYLWSCQHWIKTASKVWSGIWQPQARNLRSISSQRIWGEIFEKKKMGFPGMITSVPCMTDMTRESSIIEKRAVLAEWSCRCGLSVTRRPIGQAPRYWSKTRLHGSQQNLFIPSCFQSWCLL